MWRWYVVYCVLMALMYLAVAVAGVVFLVVPAHDLELKRGEAVMYGVMFIAMGSVLLVPYAAAAFLPRRKWAWIVGIVLIGIGMTSCCCMPAAIPLLIHWLKSETKTYFGVAA